jgi:hypothetical protein
MPDRYDQFQIWVIDMDDAIERFLGTLSSDIRGYLDFSPESLSVLETWLLKKYSSSEETRSMTEARTIDGAARYIGEVFRKKLGGKWKIDFSDEKNAFFGLPQLSGMAGQKIQMCPTTLVTASVHRRTGRFIREIYDNNAREVNPSPNR